MDVCISRCENILLGMTVNPQQKKRIGISGSYGGLNLGDEAILHVIMADLRRSIPVEITVFSRDAEDTTRRHNADRVVAARNLSRGEAKEIIRTLDLFILGGGGILYDQEADVYLREVILALEAKVPVMIYAVSVGPLEQPSVRTRVREVLDQTALITVRDRKSSQLLEEIGVRQNIIVTADPALLLESESLTLEQILRSEAIDPQARLIGLSVREPGPAAPNLNVEHYHRLLANAADFMVDRLEAEVVFFPMERKVFDVQHSHGVVAQMRHAQRATVLKRDYAPGEIVSLLTHFQFAVGMRLHFLIFSALAGVPFVALPYATKITGFLEDLQIHAPDLQHVSAGQLIANIDRAWDLREGLRGRIQSALRDLKTRALQNNELLVQLLTGSGANSTKPDAGI